MRGLSMHIDHGDRGIDQTLAVMDRLADRAASDASVIALAQNLIRWTPARDIDAEARSIDAWVRSRLRFTRDPTTAEAVKDPVLMVREVAQHGNFAGDCDDAVTLDAALLRAVGIPTQFVVVAELPWAKDAPEFTHVLLQYESPRRGWVPLDPITKKPVGWFPEHTTRVAVQRNGAPMVDVTRSPERSRVETSKIVGLVLAAALVWWLTRRKR